MSFHDGEPCSRVRVDELQAEGMDQNLVALYGHSGIPPQEAYDKIDVLLKARYREWYLAQADLPQWGETIDRQVQHYIRAMQDVITANMYWR